MGYTKWLKFCVSSTYFVSTIESNLLSIRDHTWMNVAQITLLIGFLSNKPAKTWGDGSQYSGRDVDHAESKHCRQASTCAQCWRGAMKCDWDDKNVENWFREVWIEMCQRWRKHCDVLCKTLVDICQTRIQVAYSAKNIKRNFKHTNWMFTMH